MAIRLGSGAAILAACLCVLASSCSGPSIRTVPAASGLLVAYDERWIGGDGVFSVPLEEGTRLWLFGDTWVATPDGGTILVSNTLGLQTGPCESPFQAFWGSIAERPTAALVPKDGRGWLWPAGGLCIEGYLYLFFHQMDRRQPGGPWDFFPRGTELIRVPGCRGPPGVWKLERISLPWDPEEFLLGSAPILVGSHVLAYGTRPAGPARELVLARIRLQDFMDLRLDLWEYFEGQDLVPLWGNSASSAKGLFPGIGTEFTVVQERNGAGWICLYTPNGISPKILIRRATHPQGPWGPPVCLYMCPEEAQHPNLYCYGAKLHPNCLGKDLNGFWITYAVNTRDSTPARGDQAKPRWIWILPQHF